MYVTCFATDRAYQLEKRADLFSLQPLMADFNKLQQEFIQSKQSQEPCAAVLPWIGAKNEDLLRSQILGLSSVSVFFWGFSIDYYAQIF